MIRLHNLNVKFNQGSALEKHALKDISLTIEEGECVTIIGGNGAGKSTLLSAFCGDIAPSEGEIEIAGEFVTRLPNWQRAQLIARVFQDPMAGTCSQLSIEENLSLALKRGAKRSLKHALTKEKKEEFKHHLARLGLGLEKRMKDPIGTLSGGQRQAISLIMAALAPMKILALDEHTAALDPKTATFIIDLTQQLIAENHLTALMVTHSMSQALAVGSRTLMLSEGRIVYDVKGSKRQQLTRQDLLDLFHTHELQEEMALN